MSPICIKINRYNEKKVLEKWYFFWIVFSVLPGKAVMTTLDIFSIILTFNVHVTLAIQPRRKNINRAVWLVHIIEEFHSYTMWFLQDGAAPGYGSHGGSLFFRRNRVRRTGFEFVSTGIELDTQDLSSSCAFELNSCRNELKSCRSNLIPVQKWWAYVASVPVGRRSVQYHIYSGHVYWELILMSWPWRPNHIARTKVATTQSGKASVAYLQDIAHICNR